jgi:chromosome segregation ATPase
VATDRQAELSIKTTLEGTDEAAAKLGKLNEQTGKLGDVAGAASSGLQDTAAAIGQVAGAGDAAAGSAENASGAIAGMGAAGGKAGTEIASGAGQSASALGDLAVAADRSGEAAKEAGKKGKTAAESAAEAFREEVRAIKASEAPLKEKIAALRQLETQAEQAAEEFRQLGGTELTAGIEAGLADVRAELAGLSASVNKSGDDFTGLSAEAQAAMSEVRTAVLTVDSAIINAAKEVRVANEQFEETGQIATAQYRQVVQAIEAVKIAQQEQGAVGESEARAQTAALEKLETQLTTVTSRANALTNATRDNSVRLKESGDRIAGIGLAVQDLGQFAGPTGQAIGNVAARVGLLGSTVEQAKDALHGLNVNQLGAAKGALGLGTQVAAVIAVLAAAAKAGNTLATANRENADEWEALKKVVLENFNPLDGILTRLDGLQRGLQQASFEQFVRGLYEGRVEVDLFSAALDAGLSKSEARRLADEKHAHVILFLRDAQASGADGMALWAKAVEDSAGSAEALSVITRDLRGEMDRVKLAAERLRVTESLLFSGLTERLRGDVIPEMSKTADIINEAALALLKLESANNGTTVSINDALTRLREFITGGSQFTLEATRMAGALRQVLDRTKNLTSEQRANIQAVIDAALRNDELTESERRLIDAVAASIIAGKNKTAGLAEQLAANDALKASIDSLIETVTAETAAQDANLTAIGRAAQAAQEQLAANEGLDVSRRAQLETIIDAAKRIDELKQAQDALKVSTDEQTAAAEAQAEATRELNAVHEELATGASIVIGSLDEIQAARDRDFAEFQRQTQERVEAEGQLTVALSGRRAELQRQIEEQKQLLAATAAQATANDELALSTAAITTVTEGSRTTFTNTATDVGRLKDAVGEASEAIGTVLVKKSKDGAIAIESVGDAGEKTGIKLGEGTKAIDRTGEAADAAAAIMRDQLIPILGSLETLVDRLNPKFETLASNVAKVGKNAETAAGSD